VCAASKPPARITTAAYLKHQTNSQPKTTENNQPQHELRAPGSGDLAFALPVDSRRSSVVTIEVAADAMRFVTNASPGRITGD
jgi:hypothetical protein